MHAACAYGTIARASANAAMPAAEARLAVVALVRNEARWLPEWIAYHALPAVGVDRFFLYDDGSHDESMRAGLYAVDLESAYRFLPLQEADLWTQVFLWDDGVGRAGYIVDRRQGTTGEFGGFFAITKTVGGFLPGMRLAKVLNWVGAKLKRFPKARSHEADLPTRWKGQGRSHGVRTDEAW